MKVKELLSLLNSMPEDLDVAVMIKDTNDRGGTRVALFTNIDTYDVKGRFCSLYNW